MGTRDCNYSRNAEPARVERNLPDLVLRGTVDYNRNAESARLLGTCQFRKTRDYNYNRNAEPARVMGNLPKLKETCQSSEEPARFSCEGNWRLQQERRICQS